MAKSSGGKSVRFAMDAGVRTSAGDAKRSGDAGGRRAALTQELLELEDELADRSRLLDTLKALPQKLSYETQVPLTRFALQSARLERTNEILVDIGGGFYSWQSSYQAQVILCRRLNVIVERIDSLKEQIMRAGQEELAKEDAEFGLNDKRRADQLKTAFQSSVQGPPEFRLSEEEAEAIHLETPAPKPYEFSVTAEEHKGLMERLQELSKLESEWLKSPDTRRPIGETLNEEGEQDEEYHHRPEKSHQEVMAELDKLERLEKEAEQEVERAKEAQRRRLEAEEAELDAKAALAERNAAANATASSSVSTSTPSQPPQKNEPVVIGRVVERSQVAPHNQAGKGAGGGPKKMSLFKQRRQAQQ